MISGREVIESEYATKAGEPVTVTVRRTWGQRLFGRPWQPWVKTTTHTTIPQVPAVLMTRNAIVVHPALMPAMRDLARHDAMYPERRP